MATSRDFIERVVVWPGPNNPGWINLHANLKNDEPQKNGGKPWVLGWPYKSLDAFMIQAGFIDQTTNLFNAWVCMSQQSKSGVNLRGKPKAIRLAENAVALKAIWIDCDVKANDPRHYATHKEAWAAIRAFRQKVGLPLPSAVVDSGGGLHVYWISETPLDPNEWRLYANGLKALLMQEGVKCDAGLTTDAARLLRVPGTYNHKYSPPREVRLLELGASYNFSERIRFLKDYNPNQTSPQSMVKVSPADVIIGAFDTPAPGFATLGKGEELAANCRSEKLLDPKPIFEKCAFLGDALATGGKDYDNPLWHLSVLCTTFMEGGEQLAHEISKGYVKYDAAETQALYERKAAEREARGIGYPSCATIASNGCAACASCPLFAQGKSPLNIRPVTAAVTTAPAPPHTQAPVPPGVQIALPAGYDFDADRVINEIETKRLKDGNVTEVWHPLFFSVIDNAWAERGAADRLHLHYSTDKGNWRWGELTIPEIIGQDCAKRCAEIGLKHYPKNKLRLEQFFMSFLDKMHKAAEA
ncbi:MAG: hypothetical protein KGL39_56645, partial [Patescibacteria group bacterium]|nr:hypothetical protein [Patescibacteria group bacterium]